MKLIVWRFQKSYMDKYRLLIYMNKFFVISRQYARISDMKKKLNFWKSGIIGLLNIAC